VTRRPPSTISESPPPTGQAPVAALAPVALWSFDGAASFPAEVAGDAATAPSGLPTGGSALALDGDGDYAEIADAPAFHLAEGTVQLWFRAADLDRPQALFSKDSAGYDDGGHLEIRIEDGGIKVRLQDAGESHWLFGGRDLLSPDAWHMVTFVFGEGGARLYVDGVKVDDDPHQGGLWFPDSGTGNAEPITLGASQHVSGDGRADNLDRFLDGAIDDVALFDRRLDGDAVADLFDAYRHAPATGPETPPAPGPAPEDLVLIGTDGYDELAGGDGADTIDGLGFQDHIEGFGGDDSLAGGDGNDEIHGGDGNDLIEGDTGNDTLFGHNDNDTIFGGDGDDTLIGGAQDDVLDGGAGNDEISGGWGDDTIVGGTGSDMLQGSGGNDLIDGLTGEEGAPETDYLNGGDGDDTLIGGLGDWLSGGTGSDLFVMETGGPVTITDYDSTEDGLVLFHDGAEPVLSTEAGPDGLHLLADGALAAVLEGVDTLELSEVLLIGR